MQLAEAFGGGLGGYVGGKLPDIFEPATSSRHRSAFHSVGMIGLLGNSFPVIDSWEQWCREHAEYHRAARENPSLNPIVQFFHFLAEVIFRVLAGIPAGMVTAYISHLVLDGLIDKRSIPLVA
ncbi:MAG TPA: hypothetical protein VGK27_06845 [Candidatus Deferrimicrobiaceae bacterium]|jgi:hypothetical protein